MKRRFNKFCTLFILLFAVVFLVSCDKDNRKEDALIQWTGDYAADGCGFFVTINGEEYKPENESFIDNNFKVSEGTSVKLTYRLLNKEIESSCGDSPTLTMTEGIKIILLQKSKINVELHYACDRDCHDCVHNLVRIAQV